ncbi:MAG: LysR family transcriptional regulator [Pseudomonadota bacterium]
MERLSNIANIVAFVTTAREGSVSRAADILSLTQPAVSHQLKRLSEETGIVLFTRSSGGLKLTSDGSAMLEKAEHVLQAMAEFHGHARQRAGQVGGKLKIGTVVDPEFIRLGRLLALLRSEHPGIETELMHGVSGDVLNWLGQGKIDAGFYLCDPNEVPNLSAGNEEAVHAIKLADFTYRVIGPTGWQTQLEDAQWQALALLPWIGTPPKSVHHRLLSSIFRAHECRPNVVALVDQEPSMLEMVRSGIGLSLCRDSIALHEKQSLGLAVANAVSVPACLCFVVLNRRKDNPVILETLKILQRFW